MIKTDINLIPQTQNNSPDYYCTWQSQLYACNNTGPQGQRDRMCEKDIFGEGDGRSDISKGIGWATHQYKQARCDLYLILDDSWDVPFGSEDSKWYGSLALARDKFPNAYGLENALSFDDGTPIDMEQSSKAMSRLCERIKALGWKGLGGWVCVQQAEMARLSYDSNGVSVLRDMSNEEYWKEALLRSYNAGWRYFKMDWGRDSGYADVRRLVTELSHKLTPDMWIEHAIVPEVIPESDTFRSYDAFTLMAIPLTLSRLAQFMVYETKDGYAGLINCEDEPYIAAAFGCVLGVMRHGMTGSLPNGEPDCSFPALHRNFKTKLTEVLRTVRWHRIAPAFRVSAKETFVDAQQLSDNWNVVAQKEEIEAWWKYVDGDRIEASAPARMSRAIALPEVKPDDKGYVPYVIASKNPNGAVSVATLGRTIDRRYFVPLCDITQDIGKADTVGVFGYYMSMTLKYTGKRPTKIYMQDLADDKAYDITDECRLDEGSITLSGELIKRIGCLCNADGDTSEPGVAVRLVR